MEIIPSPEVPPAEDDPVYETVWADSAHRGGTRPLPPKVLILHATAGVNSLAWLTTTPGTGVSAHLLIRKDGHIYRLVEDAGVAYHAGVSRWGAYGGEGQPSVNYVSMGVELENLNTGTDPYPGAQVLAAARAHYRWVQAYGWFQAVSHASIAPTRKTDPKGFPWDQYNQFLNEYISGVREL